ncbi:MAG: hypothetical protein HY985_18410 [Magnetospirillum sp.]|nr:hypothetical protein [Magnetospirillum sp.]
MRYAFPSAEAEAPCPHHVHIAHQLGIDHRGVTAMPCKPPCFVPPLPDILRTPTETLRPQRSPVAEEAMNAHLQALRRFQRVCAWKAAKAGKEKDNYVRSRYLDELHTKCGLRHRAWVLLDLCQGMGVPPPWQLCDLYATMDAPEGLYEFTRRYPHARMKALGVAAEDILDGITPSRRGLAKRVGVPLSTLRTWMGEAGWADALEQEVEMRRERRSRIKPTH